MFLIGGFARDEEPVALLLRSGDAVVMAGPICRRAYHGKSRICCTDMALMKAWIRCSKDFRRHTTTTLAAAGASD